MKNPRKLHSEPVPFQKRKRSKILQTLNRNKYFLLLAAPGIIFLLLFRYLPLAGLAIAFQDYVPRAGLFNSEWVGFQWFAQFFNSIFVWRLLKNTVLLNVLNLLWGFPIPILFALMINEAKKAWFRRSVQTVSYLPHFISTVIIIGIMRDLVSYNGVINQFLEFLGADTIEFMREGEWFRTLYVSSEIWQTFGWNSIIYLAAIAGISPQLYEAAIVDGSTRLQNIWYITIPSILPTIIIIFILNIGKMLSVGAEKVLLMYQPQMYEYADIISTYVYRRGILGADYSFATAVGLFESIVNFSLLIFVNRLSKKLTETALW